MNMPPVATKSEKGVFSLTVIVKVFDLGVIWKGIISGVCIPNMECPSPKVQNLYFRLKLTTDGTKTKQYATIHSIEGQKIQCQSAVTLI